MPVPNINIWFYLFLSVGFTRSSQRITNLKPICPVGLLKNCTNCYNCTEACPWKIRIPEVVRALRRELALESPFEKAFKASVALLGRVYEPYVLLRALPFLVKEGYLAYVTRWTEYITFHLPHKVKGAGLSQPGKEVIAGREPKARDRKAKRAP